MQIKIRNGLTDECTKGFEEAKRQLVFANVLSHYNPTLPNNLAADASAYE